MCTFATWGLFEFTARNYFVPPIYSASEYEKLKDNVIVVREDQFIEDVYGPHSRQTNQDWLNLVSGEVSWVLDAVELRNRLLDASDITARHYEENEITKGNYEADDDNL